MTTFHIGCAGFQRPRARYLQRLTLVEFDLRPPLPGPKALSGWKKEAPEGFVYAAVAPPALYGDRDFPLKNESTVRSEVDRMGNNVDALGAKVIVFRTPMSISPGSVGLRRLQPVLERARKMAPTVVWDPAGLWERETAVRFAKPLGVVVASDPLRDDVEGEAVVYARMRGLGSDARYSPARLEDLLSKLEGAETAYVVFASDGAWKESGQLSRLAGTLSAEVEQADEAQEEEFEEGDEDEDFDEEGDEDEGDDEDDE